MLDWIFKYKVRVPGATNKPAAGEPANKAAATPAPPSGDGVGTAGGKEAGARAKAAKPAPPAVPAVEWETRLQAALGDDSALLALAQTAGAPLQTKLAAVAALGSEATTKEAERAFRNHDRRVHSLAKQRAQGMRDQREARAKAGQLIEAAQALTAVAQIPVNSAVELDRAWLALDAALLQPQQLQAFAALTAQLSALTRQRAEHEAMLKRWTGDTRRAIENLHTLCITTASGSEAHNVLDDALAHAQALIEAAPSGADASALWTPLIEALTTAQALLDRLLVLDRVLLGPQGVELVVPEPAATEPAVVEQAATDPLAAEQEPGTAPPSAAAQPAPRAAVASPAQQWQQLPPLADSRLAAVLEQRFQAWQREQDAARQEQRAARRTQAKEQQRAVRTERAEALQIALETALAPAEASLAQGLVADTHKHLLLIDELLHAGAPADALRARIGLLQDGYAELRGWQHWAGGRARDDLTQEAVALAATCAPGPDGQLPKLQLKAHAELIDSLRARWRELDGLGGASSRALWQRFDTALKTAYEPLEAKKAAQMAAQSAAREQNLGLRRQLLDALENVALPLADASGAPAELRPAMAALEQFRVEWRRLGPLEHTVPHQAREPLAARMETALQRLQAPLDEAWQRAQQERQSLIERAQALATTAQSEAQTRTQAQAQSGAAFGSATGGRSPGGDVVGEVRALQNQWQHCAKALPLPRNAENALWGQFRSALDAVFSAREAVFSARDAEFKAGADERLALIERLEALGQATPAETQRTLAETHALWQRCGPAPRAQAAALDERFWRAHDAAGQWLAGSQQRSWQASSEALAAKLALCEALERGAATTSTTATATTDSAPAAEGTAESTAAAWAALPALPDALEAALRQRAGLPAAASAAAAVAATTVHSALSLDAVLLQLEAAWNMTSPPVFAAARRDLQLQAMKAALETRRASAAGAAATTPDQWLAEALRRQPQAAAQRERLGAVLAALRQRGPVQTPTQRQTQTPTHAPAGAPTRAPALKSHRAR